MRNQRCGVESPLLDEREDFGTVATVHAAGLECKVLAIHLRQRQGLRFFVECDNGYNRVRSCTFPGKLECRIRACDFKHNVSTSG